MHFGGISRIGQLRLIEDLANSTWGRLPTCQNRRVIINSRQVGNLPHGIVPKDAGIIERKGERESTKMDRQYSSEKGKSAKSRPKKPHNSRENDTSPWTTLKKTLNSRELGHSGFGKKSKTAGNSNYLQIMKMRMAINAKDYPCSWRFHCRQNPRN
jgi:hypothetical protein